MALAAAVALAPACLHREPVSQPTTLTSAPMPAAPEPPGDRLADELCQRERACGRIDRSRRYPSVETCLLDLSVRITRELDQWPCKADTSPARLDECILAVRSAPCETALDRIDRLPVCRSAAVCGE
jgi:hypothetical protein